MLENLDLNEQFRKELEKLNEAQRAAVESIEGPVLVIAGPGTGKTQILSARIGNILYNTQTEPQNILCLTYTEAGTIAMRKRLLRFIGPDAYRVHIHTFHSFCNKVIQDNLSYFGFRELQPLSDLECAELYRRIIDEFPANHPLKRFTGDLYYDAYRLKELFDTMKREDWSPEHIDIKIDEYLEDIKTRDEYIYKRANSTKGIKAGDLNLNKYQKEAEAMAKLRVASAEYHKMRRYMKEMRRYDYNDMILWVLQAFREEASLLSFYQERYHYFLVDEYQDTNGAQNEILNLLTSFWDVPNVFVVGDDDQAIYRFQGANVSNIIDFYDRHKQHLKIVIMTENYRSVQPVLDCAGALIENNDERLVKMLKDLNKDLVASAPDLMEQYISPQIRAYHNTLHEEAGIVDELEHAHNNGEDLSEIAVIYRNHRLVANMVTVLEKRNIPLNIKQKINILELPFINNLIKVLQYVQEEYDRPHSAEWLLYEIMHYAYFGISPRDIAKLTRYCDHRETEHRKKWREVLASRELLFRLDLESAKAISALEENLTNWIKELPNITIQVLFEKIITKGSVIRHIMNSPDKVWLMQVITTFFDFLKEESAKKDFMTLKELLSTIEMMRKDGIPIHINKLVHHEKGVNFITAHSSKGLEYKTVYLISATADCWDKAGRRFGFKMPDNLIQQDEKERAEDERRLFYVAMTRAKKHLIISYPEKKMNDKEEEPSRFITEILAKHPLKTQQLTLEDHKVIDFQAQIMKSIEPPSLDEKDIQFTKEELRNYKMSITHLNKYLRCPLSFYFENILKVPSARNEHTGFGTAIHHALYRLFLAMMQHEENKFPDERRFLQYFDEGMNMYRSHFTEEQYNRRLEYAKQLLPAYHRKYAAGWHKNVKVEYRIAQGIIDGVPVTGILDKIEMIDSKTVNVVDYKTGDPDNGRKKLNPPGEKEPLGGDYWRQIVFYKLLLDNDKSGKMNMLSGEIDFIQPNNKGEYIRTKVFVNDEDIATVRDQIKTTYRKIMNLEFTKGCGDKDCSWCNFVKHNYTFQIQQDPSDDADLY